MRDLACVIHVHSTWSDGTGTVPQIMRAAAKAGVDVVLLTDHDTLAARDHGQEGWHGDVLLLVGEEVTPDENHYLAFGNDTVIRKSGRSGSLLSPADFGLERAPARGRRSPDSCAAPVPLAVR